MSNTGFIREQEALLEKMGRSIADNIAQFDEMDSWRETLTSKGWAEKLMNDQVGTAKKYGLALWKILQGVEHAEMRLHMAVLYFLQNDEPSTELLKSITKQADNSNKYLSKVLTGELYIALDIAGSYADAHYKKKRLPETPTASELVEILLYVRNWLKLKEKDPSYSGYPDQQTATKRRLAKMVGAKTELSNKMALITGKDHSKALSTNQGGIATLFMLTEEFSSNLIHDPQTGIVHKKGSIDEVTPSELIEHVKVNGTYSVPKIAHNLFTVVWDAMLLAGGTEVQKVQGGEFPAFKVFYPSFCKSLGIKHNEKRLNKVKDELKDLSEKAWGWDGKRLSRVFIILSWEPETNVVHFAAPYFTDLINSMAKHEPYQVKTKHETYLKPYVSRLIKSSLYSERNKDAAAIVKIIVTLLEQTGVEPTSPSNTPHKKYSEIVKEIPTLRERIDKQAPRDDRHTTASKNTVLRRAFQKAYKLLQSHTTIYNEYRDFTISDFIPTTTTLEKAVLKISHGGHITRRRGRKGGAGKAGQNQPNDA